MKSEIYRQIWPLARYTYQTLIIDKVIEIPTTSENTTIEDIYLNDPWYSIVQEIISEVSTRMDKAIEHAKEYQTDKEKIYTDFWMLPPTVAISSNIQKDTTQLIYGKKCSCSFCLIDDLTGGEIMAIWNNYLESGFPIDRDYMIPLLHEADNEFLNRRHMKLGEKLRDIPKKPNRPLVESAKYILDILHDIRNELHPERANATFFICVALVSGAINQLVMKSNYDVLATIWDGVNSKNLGFPEQYFFYYPWPPILNTLFAAPRPVWIQRLTALTSKGRFYINHQETDCKNMNEIFGRDRYLVPNKEQILNAQIPSIIEGRDTYIFPETDNPIPLDIESGTFLD